MSDGGEELVVSGGRDAEGGVAALAAALIEGEHLIDQRRPLRVVLADDSDLALGAALATAKLELPLLATEAARDRTTANGRLIAQLTPGLDSAR